MNPSTLTAVILLFGIVPATATEPDVGAQLRRQYSPDAIISAEFDQSIYWSVREKTSKTHGTITCAPGNRFRVTMGKDTYVSDGTTCWQYSSANNQVVIRNLTQFDPSTLPSRLLATALSDYRFTETGRTGGVVTLTSRPDSAVCSVYKNVKIDLLESGGTITRLVTTDCNDNIHTYRFKKTVFGKPADAATFTFEAPTDANVIDYRK